MSGSPGPDPGPMARPATVEDLKRLAAALAAEGVDYALIGGYALNALGYARATTDIDLLVRPTREQGERARRALSTLPDGVAAEIGMEGVRLRTLDLEGLLKTKQSVRDKDKADREVLESALEVLRAQAPKRDT